MSDQIQQMEGGEPACKLSTSHVQSKWGQLTTRQALFVDHYALCGNASEAARLAGYSANTSRQIGSRLLSHVDVKAALQARQRAFQAELKVTRQDVVNGLLSAIQMGREQQNPGVIISGLVQIAKMLGFYEPERESPGGACDVSGYMAKFAAMTDAELFAIASGSCYPMGN